MHKKSPKRLATIDCTQCRGNFVPWIVCGFRERSQWWWNPDTAATARDAPPSPCDAVAAGFAACAEAVAAA